MYAYIVYIYTLSKGYIAYTSLSIQQLMVSSRIYSIVIYLCSSMYSLVSMIGTVAVIYICVCNHGMPLRRTPRLRLAYVYEYTSIFSILINE